MSKVVKFGGSSLASAEQFKKVGDIIRAEADRKYVVPSAPGKRNSKDTKVTDMLYACYALAEAGKNFDKELNQIKARYEEIIKGLDVGHGIGRNLHESPEVPNFGLPGRGPRLLRGMTLAIEPMVNAGGAAIRNLSDGWTVKTLDGSLSAHYENTILITDGEPELLTVTD